MDPFLDSGLCTRDHFNESRFKAAVEEAIAVTARVLGAARKPALPSDVHHVYADKYTLAETQVSAAVVSLLQALSALGVTPDKQRTLHAWASGNATVSLRFTSSTACAFLREAKRDVSSSKTVQEQSIGATVIRALSSHVVTNVTEYWWDVAAAWELIAFRGTGRGEGDILPLSSRANAHLEVKTNTKHAPYADRKWAPLEVPIQWLFAQLEAPPSARAAFHINRAHAKCWTPRRNLDVEIAQRTFVALESWAYGVRDFILMRMVPIQAAARPERLPDTSSLHADRILVPSILFEEDAARLAEVAATEVAGAAGAATGVLSLALRVPAPVVSMVDVGAIIAAPPSPPSVIMDITSVNRLLQEGADGLSSRIASLSHTLPPVATSTDMLTCAEGTLLITTHYLCRVIDHASDGLNFIEHLLRQQVIAAVGKVLAPSDFGGYMRFHARRLFRTAFEPRPLCFSVRRSPDHSPEGTLRINEAPVGDAPPESILTVSAVAAASRAMRMDFALNAETRVQFGGERHLHAWLSHRFSAAAKFGVTTGPSLSLVASSRQFSSYIVLVGRISSATSFDPTSAFIVQNKDEITIPLTLSVIPTPKEFKDAIASLSPEQQRFAKAFRAMQLESTLFGVLVLHIKPQLELLLNLAPDSLTKEVALTQDLMDLFIKYQIPADLLSGPLEGDRDVKLAAVKGHVAAMHVMIAKREDTVIENRIKEEKMSRDRAAQFQLQLFHMVQQQMAQNLPMPFPSPLGAGAPRQSSPLKDRRRFEPEDGMCAPTHEREGWFSWGGSHTKNMEESQLSSMSAMGEGHTLSEMDTLDSMGAVMLDSVREGMSMGSAPTSHARALLGSASGGPDGGRSFAAAGTGSSTRRSAAGASAAGGDARGSAAGAGASTAGGATTAFEVEEGIDVGRDLSKVPLELDANYARLDTESSLRATILTPSSPWQKTSHASILSKSATHTTLGADEQKDAKAAAFDLLDALSRSGGLPMEAGDLHVIMAATHCFDESVMDTVIQRNINPIERVERSLLIMATTLHQAPVSSLVRPEHVIRLQGLTPALF